MATELRVGERSEHVAKKILARQAIQDVFVAGNIDRVDDLFTPDAALHLDCWGTGVTGRRALRRHVTRQHEIFSDCEATVESLVIDGDEAIAYCTMRGRHTGMLPVPGRGPFAPTGRLFQVPTVFRFRFEDDQIAEIWRLEDALGVGDQLGLDTRGPRDLVKSLAETIREGFLRSGD
ncbi:ester cyclase [Haloarchaeobius sp. DYHT-AS-18]|uniref:ester cyclase n=1 Tax=Haloarchaeobius sp. DYHT-AS-18 TaxID=3446117 RepID=UPI003EBD5DAB